jgi:hypothetical protein
MLPSHSSLRDQPRVAVFCQLIQNIKNSALEDSTITLKTPGDILSRPISRELTKRPINRRSKFRTSSWRTLYDFIYSSPHQT